MIKTEIKPEPLNKKTFTTLQIKSLKPGSLGNPHRFLSEQWVRVSDIKSACEFYLRYKDNPELLLKEYPKYKSEFVIKCLTLCLPKERIWLKDGTIADKNKYNEWLFKLAFGNVFGDKTVGGEN